MRIVYIGHSGFFIEGERHCLLFDYYIGALPEVPPGKTLTVLVSHHHQDHLNPEIFRYGEKTAGTHYLLGRDVSLSPGMRIRYGITEEMQPRCIRMHTDDLFECEDLRVQALRSTDAGAAYYAECEGRHIYHAGDLNLWDPDDRQMTENFLHEIGKLRSRPVDAAFLPLDPRCGEHFHVGADSFIRLMKPDRVFPMHLWEDYDAIARFKNMPCAKEYCGKITDIRAMGDEFEI